MFTSLRTWLAIRPAGLDAPGQIGRVERRGCHAQKEDVDSHQGHARFRQRIDG